MDAQSPFLLRKTVRCLRSFEHRAHLKVKMSHSRERQHDSQHIFQFSRGGIKYFPSKRNYSSRPDEIQTKAGSVRYSH